MKLFKFLATVIVAVLGQAGYNPDDQTPPPGLSCFHCDAANMTHCEAIGEMKPCMDNAQSCMIEVRKRNGYMEQVFNTPLTANIFQRSAYHKLN